MIMWVAWHGSARVTTLCFMQSELNLLMWLQLGLEDLRGCHPHAWPLRRMAGMLGLFTPVLWHLSGPVCHGPLQEASLGFFSKWLKAPSKWKKEVTWSFMTQSQMSHSVTDTFAAFYWLKQGTEPANTSKEGKQAGGMAKSHLQRVCGTKRWCGHLWKQSTSVNVWKCKPGISPPFWKLFSASMAFGIKSKLFILVEKTTCFSAYHPPPLSSHWHFVPPIPNTFTSWFFQPWRYLPGEHAPLWLSLCSLSLFHDNSNVSFFFFSLFLFIWLCLVLLATHGIFDVACRKFLVWHMGSSSLTKDQTWTPCIGNSES